MGGPKRRLATGVLVALVVLAAARTIAGPTADFNERVRQATARFASELSDSISAAGGGTAPDTIPPPPPPPPPPPGGQLVGGSACSGFWSGWRADDASKFTTGSGYGVMRNNVNAAIKMDLGDRGTVEFDAWHESDGCGGGQHLFYITSQTAPNIGPYDPAFPNVNGQFRVDFSVRTGKLYGAVYYDKDTGSGATITAVPLAYWDLQAYRTWAHVKVEWEQSPLTTKIRVNGVEKSFATPPGMNLLGNILVVGNLDTNRDARCSTCGHDPCGLVGEARFRGFTWRR